MKIISRLWLEQSDANIEKGKNRKNNNNNNNKNLKCPQSNRPGNRAMVMLKAMRASLRSPN